jgi:hypothetical protein
MLAFMDESGDCGLEFARSSSSHFTYALVQFPGREQAVACREAIRQLRKDVLHLDDTFEFHFTECSHAQRVAFFDTVLKFDFRFGARTIEKANLKGKKGWDKKRFFFQRALDLMLAGVMRPHLVGAKLLIDGTTDKKFNRRLRFTFAATSGSPKAARSAWRKSSAWIPGRTTSSRWPTWCVVPSRALIGPTSTSRLNTSR